MHIIGNMWFLWIFGDNLEDRMGRGRYLAFYLLCGVIAATAQIVATPDSMAPMIGASGAIAGVLGAYLLLYPYAKVHVLIWIVIFVRIIAVPAWIMLGLWFGLQLLDGLLSSPDDAGVAFWAHVGGFVSGMALLLVSRPRGTVLLQPPKTQSFALAAPREFRTGYLSRLRTKRHARRRGREVPPAWPVGCRRLTAIVENSRIKAACGRFPYTAGYRRNGARGSPGRCKETPG
jgi:hypothetical protein